MLAGLFVVLLLLIGWIAILATGITALPPGTWLMDMSYESRNRAQIVRASPLAGFGEPSSHSKLIARQSKDDAAAEARCPQVIPPEVDVVLL